MLVVVAVVDGVAAVAVVFVDEELVDGVAVVAAVALDAVELALEVAALIVM